MRNYFLLLVILFTVSPLRAQNYEPGYIVTNEKDTIAGSIMTGTDADLSRIIIFKRAGGTSKKYAPEELLGFGFNNGRIFERKIGVITSEKEIDSTYIFAKNLVRGKIDLFVLRFPNRIQPDIFLTNNSTNKTVQLSKPEKREIIGKDEKKYSAKDNRYVGNLALIKNETFKGKNLKPIRFSEKRIKKDILSYNENFLQEFPINVYKEEIENSYGVVVGIPIRSSPSTHLRIGIYRNKRNIEKSAHVSLLQGVVYHHYDDGSREYSSRGNVERNFKTQLLNIIPIGINYQGKFGLIHPYGYAGLGLAAGKSSFHIVENSVYTGDTSKFLFSPTLNLGVGVKFRIQNVFIITEVTPTFKGVFFSSGFSI